MDCNFSIRERSTSNYFQCVRGNVHPYWRGDYVRFYKRRLSRILQSRVDYEINYLLFLFKSFFLPLRTSFYRRCKMYNTSFILNSTSTISLKINKNKKPYGYQYHQRNLTIPQQARSTTPMPHQRHHLS